MYKIIIIKNPVSHVSLATLNFQISVVETLIQSWGCEEHH